MRTPTAGPRGVADADDDQQWHDHVVEDVHGLAHEPHATDGHHSGDGDRAKRQQDARNPAERQHQKGQADQEGERDQSQVVRAHLADDDAAEVRQAADV